MLRKAWNGIFGTVADSAETVRNGIGVVNHYVQEEAEASKHLTTYNAQMRLAQGLRDHKQKLKDDSELNTLFEEVQANWRKAPEQEQEGA